jgi:predicted LPLAT superfamily acyltransferase
MGRLDAVVDFLGPQAGWLQHLAKVQAQALLHQLALLHGRQKTADKALQRLAQAEIGLVEQRAVIVNAAQRFGERGAVKACLVAKVVADGGDVGASGQGNLTR